MNTLPHTRGPFRIVFLKLFKACAQAFCVELADGKRSDTALGAAGMTDEPLAAAARCIGQRCIYDLHELLIG